MNISPITQVPPGVAQHPLADQIEQVKQANQDAALRNSTSTADEAVAANITTSSAYSPVVVAQAAQFQLYTQAGMLVTMASGHQPTSHSNTKSDHPIGINRIEKMSGNSVDTRT